MKQFLSAALLFSFAIFCGQLANSQSEYFAEDGIYAAMETALCGQSIVNDIPQGRVYIFRQAGNSNCSDPGFPGTFERLSPSLFLRKASTVYLIDQDEIETCLANPTKYSCPTFYNEFGQMIAGVGNKIVRAVVFNVLSAKAFKFTEADLLINNKNNIINVTYFDRDDRIYVRKGPLNFKPSLSKKF